MADASWFAVARGTIDTKILKPGFVNPFLDIGR